MSTTELNGLWANLMNAAIIGDVSISSEIEKHVELMHEFEFSNFKLSPMQVAIMNDQLDFLKDLFENVGITSEIELDEPEVAEGEPVDELAQEVRRPSNLALAIIWDRFEIAQLLLEYEANFENIDLESIPEKYVELINSVKEGTLVNIYKIDNKKKKKKK